VSIFLQFLFVPGMGLRRFQALWQRISTFVGTAGDCVFNILVEIPVSTKHHPAALRANHHGLSPRRGAPKGRYPTFFVFLIPQGVDTSIKGTFK